MTAVPPAAPGRDLSRSGSVVVGLILATAGVALVTASIYGSAEKFNSPRWVVAAAGGAFVFFGGWTALVYAPGYDPERPERLPSPGLQLLFFIPGLTLFAAPFHWIAFGRGPRAFSSTFSIPFVSFRDASNGTGGRIAFGIGAVRMDLFLIAIVVRLIRQMRRPARPGSDR